MASSCIESRTNTSCSRKFPTKALTPSIQEAFRQTVSFLHAVVQFKVPLIALNVPGAHAEQVPPSAPAQPALHKQSVIFSLPCAENESAGQAEHVSFDVAATFVEYVPPLQNVQACDPLTSLYVPGKHASHACPFGPV